MKNLLRKCENCVFVRKFGDETLVCQPKLPEWIIALIKPNVWLNRAVSNNTAENCDAFRLRETGVNE